MSLRASLLLIVSATTAFAGSLDQARTLMAERKYAEARALLETALKEPSVEPEAALMLTRACNALADWEAGVKHGKRAVKLLPDSSEAHHEYAVALRLKMSSVSKVKAMFLVDNYRNELKRAIELDPGNTDAISERIGFLINAPGIAGGDLEQAEKEIAALEKLDWLLARQMQVGVELKREDLPAAMRVNEEILERHPDHAATRLSQGYLLQRAEQYQKADEQFAQLAKSHERTVALNALYQRGRTRVLGAYELEKAVAFLEQYIAELGVGEPGLPDEPAALWRMGMAYEGLGRTDKARASYEKALALDPENEAAKQALKKLR